MSKLRSVLSWIGWLVAAVLALLHIKRRADITVTPSKVEAPPGQDMTGTLDSEEIERMRKDVDEAMRRAGL